MSALTAMAIVAAVAAVGKAKGPQGWANRAARVDKLWIGTKRYNLAGILDRGVVPSGGQSVHRTKTRSAVFLAGDPEAALIYADHDDPGGPASVNDPILLEVDTRGLALLPDYDDVDIGPLLEELSTRVGADIEPGVPLGELESAVEDALYELEDGDHLVRAEIEDEGDDRVLAIIPGHRLPVDDRVSHLQPDLYDELDWRDGDVKLLTTQYQYHGVIPLDRVHVYALARGGKRPGDLELKSYNHLVYPYKRFYNVVDAAEADAPIEFLRRRFRRYTPAEARRLLRAGR
jgi:hypothetical protein